MKISIDFEPDGKPSQIPLEEKLRIINRIVKAAHNPVEFIDLDIAKFRGSDK